MVETFILERIEEKVIELISLIVSDLLIHKEKSLESIDDEKRKFTNKLCDVLVILFRCQPPNNFTVFCDYEKTKNSIKSLYDKSIEEYGHFEVFSMINQIFNDETIRDNFSHESFKEVESVLLKKFGCS